MTPFTRTPFAAADSSASASAGGRGIEADHFARARLGGRDAEAAGIAVGVEHRLAFSQRCQEGAVVALVVIPAGLLPGAEIGEIARAVLLDRDAPRFALGGADIFVETLERARRRVVAQDHVCRLQHLVERLQQRLGQRLHSRGGDLRHKAVAEAIDRKSRQSVALGVHQPIERPGIERRAQRQRALQPAHEEAGADDGIDRLVQHAQPIRLFGLK
ncbi:MAG: hypothetical protein WDM81_21835 [Rhizomicrobium sp.]